MLAKTVKLLDNGEISIPLNIRELIGINKGDELLIKEKNGKVLIEKKDDFQEIQKFAENSLMEVWNNEKDEVWNEYLKNEY
jgi:AbrB family looped-hinge helix DNA binding protein